MKEAGSRRLHEHLWKNRQEMTRLEMAAQKGKGGNVNWWLERGYVKSDVQYIHRVKQSTIGATWGLWRSRAWITSTGLIFFFQIKPALSIKCSPHPSLNSLFLLSDLLPPPCSRYLPLLYNGSIRLHPCCIKEKHTACVYSSPIAAMALGLAQASAVTTTTRLGGRKTKHTLHVPGCGEDEAWRSHCEPRVNSDRLGRGRQEAEAAG